MGATFRQSRMKISRARDEFNKGITMSEITLDSAFYQQVRSILNSARNNLYQSANSAMLMAYWCIQKWNITEALKAEDPMRWVGLMNNARNEVEWFITKELIFN